MQMPNLLGAYTKSPFRGLGALNHLCSRWILRLVILGWKFLLETTTVAARDAISQEDSDYKRLCYSMAWKPDVGLLDFDAVVAYCNIKQFVSETDPIEFYIIAFISRTLEKLALQETQDLKPHLESYVAWMLLQLERFRNGEFATKPTNWVSASEDAAYIDALTDRVFIQNREGRLFATVDEASSIYCPAK